MRQIKDTQLYVGVKEEYFIDLTNDFLKVEQIKPTNIFLTHGMTDFLDPEGVIKKQIVDFSQRIKSKDNIVCKLKIYDDEGHVPFQSLYHGLRFIYVSSDESMLNYTGRAQGDRRINSLFYPDYRVS